VFGDGRMCLLNIVDKTFFSAQIESNAEMAPSRRYGEPGWTERPFEDLTTHVLHPLHLQHFKHTDESYEERRIPISTSVAISLSSNGLSYFAKRQLRQSQSSVSSYPPNAMSTKNTAARNASSETESDEGELPHKLVRSQLESVVDPLLSSL
jgi:hypothetical protein